ncbi:putative polypeptide deformylase-like protein [Trypanosoma cruzi]|uniref:Peptide deformylase n=2 Tax=Trypanosoma cruzi TaxID=5693 RepID=Q4DNK4_TRYCC|nr:polypeptide deformylase-like protein, putative [Trypanosoma cruzi]EAN94106.1 polypeptide deformylase-like protein, putative [Trypanosoma cruzi]PWV18719.1 putative polypeptide deformylase-like protein [Trypanosoma cruzi]RNC49134.1 polypeptide deformylase-like protein [Trypanosoma cruzi]|eukprot:XP_815957.1 polypeptide deformylase-like protein [Trypanosoma cruzi strain CL Brener]
MLSRLSRTVPLLGPRRSAAREKRLKDRVAAQLELEAQVKSRVACYPHRSLTRPALRLDKTQVNTPLFQSQLLSLKKMASDLRCISFSAPKGHWDATVVLIKGHPDEEVFEVWVSPSVPDYDARTSIAPMYGMWENCISCGATAAWVIRPQCVTCSGWDEYGNEKTELLDGMRARCLMHELDHLHGKTILHQALGPEFIVSGIAMGQRDLWPPNFPSAEAYVTAPHQFFDYVKNIPIVPPGMEWWYAQNMQQHFQDARLNQ